MGEIIFRTYDREALDREYDNRRKVATAAQVLAWYTAESEATRRQLACRLDVPYGTHPGETLDIFLPPAGAPAPAAAPAGAPVHVFIHGGYWHRLDKADFSYVARVVVPAGAALVAINYALMPAVSMGELVRQCRAAVAWVHENAPSFGGDRSRLFLSGHSAGGHLVAMVMATDWPRFREASGRPLPERLVAGATAISGIYDLEPIRLCYLNDVLHLTAEDVRAQSPVRLRPAERGPLLVTLGEREGPEYHRQSEDLVTAWRGHGTSCELLDLPGHDHFSIMADLGDPKSALSRAVLGQMGL
jgi:arylformamidase